MMVWDIGLYYNLYGDWNIGEMYGVMMINDGW